MFSYERTACYHETDQMGIIHHSNYVKWMEEARIAFLERVGMPYRAMEENGLVSPVVGIEVAYKKPVRFSERVRIDVRLAAYTGVRLTFAYTVVNEATNEICTTALSHHCFLQGERIVSLKKSFPQTHAHLLGLIEEA